MKPMEVEHRVSKVLVKMTMNVRGFMTIRATRLIMHLLIKANPTIPYEQMGQTSIIAQFAEGGATMMMVVINPCLIAALYKMHTLYSAHSMHYCTIQNA